MDPEPSSLFLIISINWPLAIGIFALLVLLIFSALISGSEVAFFSLSKADLEDNSSNISPKKQLVIHQLERPKKLLATILIANNFINILIVLLFAYLGEFFFSALAPTFRFLLEVVLITFLILLFGEVKYYSSHIKHSMKWHQLI